MSMLSAVWGESPSFKCVAGFKGKAKEHYWFNDVAAAEAKAKALDGAGYDVYFAPSLFSPERVETLRQTPHPQTGRPQTGRSKEAVSEVKALWVDVDWGDSKGYPGPAQAGEALKQWVERTGQEPTYIVLSGNGLHAYWVMDRAYPVAEWLPVAQHLKQACALKGFRIDPVRTADAASLLRVPGTHNRKADPVPVQLFPSKGKTYTLDLFKRALPAVGPQRSVTKPDPNDEFAAGNDLPPGNIDQIVKRCGQMSFARLKMGEGIAEPYWRAVLSVLYRCEGGEQLIHEWSRADQRYDPKETEAKAQGTAGPATCRYFDEVNPMGCTGCPLAGKITSPISAAPPGNQLSLPPSEPGEAPVEAPAQLSGWKCNDTGVWLCPSEEAPVRVASVPIWIDEVRVHHHQCKAQESSVGLVWKDVHGALHREAVPQFIIFEKRELTKWLANHNIVAFVFKQEAFAMYIKQLTADHFKAKGSTTVYDALGWYEGDNGKEFVLGKKKVTKVGVEESVLEANTHISRLDIRGSADKWTDAFAKLGSRPEYTNYTFAVLAALGAPLLHATGKDGCVVALVGDSGYGKTVAATMGLSAFIDPELGAMPGSSTVNAADARMGAHRHVPVLIDEVTNVNPRKLADLIYMAANGHGKETMTRDRKVRKTSEWCTVTFFTSNHSILDMELKDIEEAHRRRLLELDAPVPVDRETTTAMIDAMTNHHGAAAVPYLKTLMGMNGKLVELFDTSQKWVEQESGCSQQDRFVVWTWTAALVAGMLGRAAGIVKFDPVPVIKRVMAAQADDYRKMQTPEEHIHEVLQEFLLGNNQHIVRWDRYGNGEHGIHSPVARVKGDRLIVPAKIFSSEVRGAKILPKHRDAFIEKYACKQRGKYRSRQRIAPDSNALPWCYEFDMNELGISADELGKKEDAE